MKKEESKLYSIWDINYDGLFRKRLNVVKLDKLQLAALHFCGFIISPVEDNKIYHARCVECNWKVDCFDYESASKAADWHDSIYHLNKKGKVIPTSSFGWSKV